MNKKNIIAFDLISGDSSSKYSIGPTIEFLSINDNYQIIGFVDKTFDLNKYENIERLSFVVCEQKIEQNDGPLQVKRKENSTLVQAIKYVVDGKADLVVSAAASGPLVTAGYLFSKPINSNYKPAFAPIAKSTSGKEKLYLDVGANLDADAETLEKYALMGTIFAKALKFSDNPRVSLLNIGSEENKGSQLMRDTYKLLKQNPSINFMGNVEPDKILRDGEEVVISDAISGNIFLKSYEGAYKIISDSIKGSIKESLLTKLGLILSYKMIRNIKSATNSDQDGGAIVLGLNHLIFKAHGGADERQFLNSLNVAKKINDADVLEKIKEVV